MAHSGYVPVPSTEPCSAPQRATASQAKTSPLPDARRSTYIHRLQNLWTRRRIRPHTHTRIARILSRNATLVFSHLRAVVRAVRCVCARTGALAPQMAFEDMVDYFSTVEACRVRPEWAEVRVRGSLPPLGGMGDWADVAASLGDGLGAFEIDILSTCDVELTLIQKNGRGDITHELADLLVLVARREGAAGASSGGANGGGGGAEYIGGLRVIAASDRSLKASVTCEALLTEGRYLVLPLSLRPRSQRDGPNLSYVLRIGSAKPILCDPTCVTAAEMRASLASYIRRWGQCHTAFDGMRMYTCTDGAGWLTYAENTSTFARFGVRLDYSGSFNVLASRSSLSTYDVLPPGHGQLLQALSIGVTDEGARMRSSTNFSSGMMSVEAHSPELTEGSMHSPLSLRRGAASHSPYQHAGGHNLSEMLNRLGVRFIG